ncbi:MAG TPA: hypothetical protein VFW87_22925, partial [Pirellulales bacterium]|nr:hypothetical protein [Pirellulales bacterium]
TLAGGNNSPLWRIMHTWSDCALERQGVLPACCGHRKTKGDVMRKLAFWSLCLSLGLFLTGCGDTATQKDKNTKQTTVETDRDTGEQTVKEESESSSTDSETGEKIETESDTETTIKPPQDDNGDATDNANDNAADNAADNATDPADNDNR